MLWDSKVKSYWFFFTFRRLKDTKVTKFTAPQIEEAATLEIQDYQKKKKRRIHVRSEKKFLDAGIQDVSTRIRVIQ